MPTTPMTFEQYCLSKGLSLPKELTPRSEIISNPEMVGRVGDMVKTYEPELRLIIGARIESLKNELLMDCTPYEVLEIRRCIMEIATLLSDIDSYIKNRDDQILFEEQERARKEKEESEDVGQSEG